ncbi:hypothetical protein SODALDRAFT_335409 [Sodiomyces alkalinus F11]|uniref:Autophagy-related protein 28 n=1 Tax=Sodiomyces alkalinus (strain CBS 110278 / VKM F-3762 / F11) TaxID=1314773 RepID=A0A3N2PP80_SODAK|nr:hypothetical protein SODALDRAFT_335409 [Sodiomyces alkalinus F11]ROT36309.1 hypothetical protein SODALDRAFT_335409 [Sodiomyces alkalinus F11]
MPASRASAFLERLIPQDSASLLPLHHKRRTSDDYNLQELSPTTEETLLSKNPIMRWGRESRRSLSPKDPWSENASSVGSDSKRKPRPVFDGPPPPVAASVMMSRNSSPSSHTAFKDRRASKGASVKLSQAGSRSVRFQSTPPLQSVASSDSVWGLLQRREKAIGKELQTLLDMQASGLVAGSSVTPFPSSATSEREHFSDDDGSSTPTATFYSTVTSKSRMMASLDLPDRATPRGDIIPVRQPKPSKSTGLREARAGLRKSMMALENLKAEEDACVDAALSERKEALGRLQDLATRREALSDELRLLAEDGEELLATELRELKSQHTSLDSEIRELEERLVGMRNRRRWLQRRMDDVRNRREAGLSGYRGALKEVEGEVASLMRRPPVEPLDVDILVNGLAGDPDGHFDPDNLPNGAEFLQLIPERRTVEMAAEWWQGEVGLLEARKKQVEKEREALADGLKLWRDCTTLVTTFESELRKLMKGEVSGKGKGKAPSLEEAMRSQLSSMGEAIAKLESYTEKAEANNWNLLICAIGAELEAFQEAERMLRQAVESVTEANTTLREPLIAHADEDVFSADPNARLQKTEEPTEESDNEVPPGLLVAQGDEDLNGSRGRSLYEEKKVIRHPPFNREESDSDMPPPEFLAEHDPEEDEGR